MRKLRLKNTKLRNLKRLKAKRCFSIKIQFPTCSLYRRVFVQNVPSHPEYSIHKHNPLQINTYISLKSKQQYHFLESLTTYSSTHQPTLDMVPFLNSLRT